MVDRFRIPPPLRPRKPGRKQVVVDLCENTAAEANSALEKAGLLHVHEIICAEWLPYAMKKINRASDTAGVPEIGATQGFHSANDWGEGLCRVMALFYLGKRLGNFRLLRDDSSYGADSGSQVDATTETISSTLEGIAEVVGRRQAAEIFRRLENVTDRILKQR